MLQPSTFQVYNASAGSGKTFTLVKEYLKVLLTSEDIFKFQKVLAITFTNKAAGEMKERVLQNLEDFSYGIENDLSKIILQEITVDQLIIQERSKKILKAILQNYSAFSITTIDSFTHKIIKNFAYDLGLSLNFEVEMDAVSLLKEAVDVLVSKIGTDKKLTQILIDYSLDKTDDDKSWDITKDLNEFSKILLNEDDTRHFRKLDTKKIDDFINLKSKLFVHQKEIEKTIKKTGTNFLQLIQDNGLQQKDFIRGTIPKFFSDISEKSVHFSFLTRSETIEKTIANQEYYTKSTSFEITNIIDAIIPQIIQHFDGVKKLFQEFTLNKLALQSLIPLAVLNNINQELEQLKEDNNIRLNAEFNQLISDNIKDQPAPFIYERIGQRFMHYFIDEMQDTSILQWQNLIPLIDNALAQENSNLLLVGDGKQAIYRWRGGKAEQFINLGSESKNDKNPFFVEKEIKQLETNFRSYSEIINFNNSFFQHTSNFLQNESYKTLFIQGNKQLENAKKGGYVSLDFLKKEIEQDKEKIKYPKKILEKIIDLKKDFSLNEICILTRTKKDGIAIADYLTEHQINIVSSETLLLQNNAKVCFAIDVLQLFQNPNNEETRFKIITFLYDHLNCNESKHSFFTKFIKKDTDTFFRSLENYQILFDSNHFLQLPFYEKVEEIIRSFHLVNSSDAFIQFFLDVVLEQQRKGINILEFLEFWELKKDKLSIIASGNANAVHIMTIHKSKGLEFPVVIFPCDVDIYRQINPKIWLNELPKTYNPFSELLVSYNKELSIVNNKGFSIYNQQREELELDNFNLLYVALTRAVEQLHIITEKKVSTKGEENINFFSGIFINFLKNKNIWDKERLEYSFGDKSRKSLTQETKSATSFQKEFTSNSWKSHHISLLANNSKLWDTKQEKAINYGNLLHEILSKIYNRNDIETVITSYENQGLINKKDTEIIKSKIKAIVHHPKLKQYYSEDTIAFNERELINHLNETLIPDRLVFNTKNEVSIIDYKTGSESKKHQQQLLKYEDTLKLMNFIVNHKIIIYINSNPKIIIF